MAFATCWCPNPDCRNGEHGWDVAILEEYDTNYRGPYVDEDQDCPECGKLGVWEKPHWVHERSCPAVICPEYQQPVEYDALLTETGWKRCARCGSETVLVPV
jgi:hypothetical protein